MSEDQIVFCAPSTNTNYYEKKLNELKNVTESSQMPVNLFKMHSLDMNNNIIPSNTKATRLISKGSVPESRNACSINIEEEIQETLQALDKIMILESSSEQQLQLDRQIQYKQALKKYNACKQALCMAIEGRNSKNTANASTPDHSSHDIEDEKVQKNTDISFEVINHNMNSLQAIAQKMADLHGQVFNYDGLYLYQEDANLESMQFLVQNLQKRAKYIQSNIAALCNSRSFDNDTYQKLLAEYDDIIFSCEEEMSFLGQYCTESERTTRQNMIMDFIRQLHEQKDSLILLNELRMVLDCVPQDFQSIPMHLENIIEYNNRIYKAIVKNNKTIRTKIQNILLIILGKKHIVANKKSNISNVISKYKEVYAKSIEKINIIKQKLNNNIDQLNFDHEELAQSIKEFQDLSKSFYDVINENLYKQPDSKTFDSKAFDPKNSYDKDHEYLLYKALKRQLKPIRKKTKQFMFCGEGESATVSLENIQKQVLLQYRDVLSYDGSQAKVTPIQQYPKNTAFFPRVRFTKQDDAYQKEVRKYYSKEQSIKECLLLNCEIELFGKLYQDFVDQQEELARLKETDRFSRKYMIKQQNLQKITEKLNKMMISIDNKMKTINRYRDFSMLPPIMSPTKRQASDARECASPSRPARDDFSVIEDNGDNKYNTNSAQKSQKQENENENASIVNLGDSSYDFHKKAQGPYAHNNANRVQHKPTEAEQKRLDLIKDCWITFGELKSKFLKSTQYKNLNGLHFLNRNAELLEIETIAKSINVFLEDIQSVKQKLNSDINDMDKLFKLLNEHHILYQYQQCVHKAQILLDISQKLLHGFDSHTHELIRSYCEAYNWSLEAQIFPNDSIDEGLIKQKIHNLIKNELESIIKISDHLEFDVTPRKIILDTSLESNQEQDFKDLAKELKQCAKNTKDCAKHYIATVKRCIQSGFIQDPRIAECINDLSATQDDRQIMGFLCNQIDKVLQGARPKISIEQLGLHIKARIISDFIGYCNKGSGSQSHGSLLQQIEQAFQGENSESPSLIEALDAQIKTEIILKFINNFGETSSDEVILAFLRSQYDQESQDSHLKDWIWQLGIEIKAQIISEFIGLDQSWYSKKGLSRECQQQSDESLQDKKSELSILIEQLDERTKTMIISEFINSFDAISNDKKLFELLRNASVQDLQKYQSEYQADQSVESQLTRVIEGLQSKFDLLVGCENITKDDLHLFVEYLESTLNYIQYLKKILTNDANSRGDAKNSEYFEAIEKIDGNIRCMHIVIELQQIHLELNEFNQQIVQHIKKNINNQDCDLQTETIGAQKGFDEFIKNVKNNNAYKYSKYRATIDSKIKLVLRSLVAARRYVKALVKLSEISAAIKDLNSNMKDTKDDQVLSSAMNLVQGYKNELDIIEQNVKSRSDDDYSRDIISEINTIRESLKALEAINNAQLADAF